MAHDFKRFPELANSQMDVYYWESPHKQILEDFRAKVIKVHDGDTITLKTDFRDFNFPLRFLDIDAPEMNAGGRTSRDWLRDRILNEEVEILINPKQRVGKWGRLLGRVFFGGMDIGEESIMMGMSSKFGERGQGTIPDAHIQLTPWS